MQQNIHSTEEFQRILEHERARSDRTGCEFCVMTFEVLGSKSYRSSIRYLRKVISQRVRCYDDIGLLDENHLGVILPGTPVETAYKIADDVCNAIIPRKVYPKYNIYSYPP